MSLAGNTATRWVVLSPTLALQPWFEAIQAGARAVGQDAMATWLDPVGQDGSSDGLIVVTDDLSKARAVPTASIVVLMPDPGSAMDAIEAATGQPVPDSAILASQHLAETHDFAGAHRLVDASARRAPDGSLELFPQVFVSPPPPVRVERGDPARTAAAGVFQDLYAPVSPGQIISNWPVALFSHHLASLIEGQPGAFDLTGRPRFLVNGPYLWMPAGDWTARIRFGVDSDAAMRRYRLDWGSVEQWTEQHFTPAHAGLYEMDLTYRFETAQPCEVRLVVTEGCFSGRLDFLGVTISKAEDGA